MPEIEWANMFGFTVSPLELVMRGSLMYLFLFAMFRFVLRRDVGAVGVADVLVLVLVADAAQNAMADDYRSIPDGMVLVSTLIAWNYLFDYLSFRFAAFRVFAKPRALCLIRDGKKLRRNMRREYITDNELDSKLRESGIESAAEVKLAHLEADGEISVIRYRKE